MSTAALSNYPLYTGDTTGFNIIANDSGETTTYTVTKETLLVGLATTGSNTFKGTQTHSGSIIPAVDNVYDLGSPTYQWRDVYISSGSLYIDGTKVISSTTQELQITTDNGQSFKILEAGSDTITLQAADGNITLATSGGGDVIMDPTTGVIALKGTTTIYSGNKIVSSDGNSIQFGNGVAITGSIVATGTNLISGSSQISFTGLSGVPSGIISASAQLDALGYSTTSSFNTFTNSFNAAISLSGTTTTLKGNLIVQGTTTQVDSTTVNISDNIIQLNGTGATNAGLVVRDATSPTLTSGSLLWDTTNDKWIAGTLGSEDDVVLRTATQTLTNKTISGASNTISNIGNSSLTNSSISIAGNSISLGGSISAATILSSTGVISGSAQLPSGTVSGSSQIDLTATTNYSSGIKTRLNAENVLSSSAQVVSALPAGTVSGSSQVLAGTTIHSGSFFNGISVVSGSGQISFGGITGVPSGLVSGSSQITFGSISSIPSGLVSGSSQITYSSISSIPSGIVSGSAQLTSTFVQKAGDTMTGALTAPGITSSAGLTVSGTSYYTFNKPSTTNYQTVALFGSTANGIFITSDSGIISRGAFFNGGWQATSTTGAYLNFNTSGGGMDLNVFSGATIGGSATFTSLFTVARDNFSFNSNSILHAGNYNSYSPTLTGTGASGNWGINITGNATTATTAGALTSMNISQFTNNSGYITGINSSAVTTALGYTPYNATNPNGYITGISFANVSSKPTTISGYGITDAITTGNIGSQSVSNAATVASLTPFQFFNNMGQNHSTQTDFNSISNFGFRFVQGATNGPGTGSSQFYGFSIGLGNDYAYSDYALQLAIPRYPASDKYITFRTREATTWGSWNKISAGYADSAGSVSGANVSGNISGNASNITSYTINQSVGTGNAVQFSSVGVGVSPAVTLHARGSGEMVRFENTSTASDGYTQLNFKAGSRNGYIWLGNQNTTSWAGAGGLNIYTENGNIDLWSNAVQRVRLQTDGHLVPFVNGTYNLGSASLRWNTVFTSDLSLSNGIGDYTIVEGEEKLYLYNNKNNKVYSFVLQEEDPTTATPKKS
jgi:hypothetical protein